MSGILYGVGVGPGDPRLITYLAADTIRSCPVIAVPAETKEQAVSYRIASGLITDLDKKQCLTFSIPMTKDKGLLLKAGRDVACLTLGDPTVYSTYIYLHRLIRDRGYRTEIISGVPSFCAVSARLGDSLADRSQQLHIIPSAYGVEDALKLPGTKVLMKAGSKMAAVKEALERECVSGGMVENCGMENESIFQGVQEIPDKAGYYSLIVIKEQK